MEVVEIKENYMNDLFNKSRITTIIEWHNLSLTINGKVIFSNISGCIQSGELSAILGPSGSGKTSLLNVLSGRIGFKKGTEIKGEIKVNGIKINPLTYRKNVAYVMQEDTLYPTSTPREAIEMSAKLKNENKCNVDKIIENLKIDNCQNTIIGSKLLKGISGGEKKRTSIGIEMVTEPQIIFLDEPTSGLDIFSAWKVVNIMKDLAKSGRVVLASIHQPSSEIFDLFDKATFLESGKLIYNGRVRDMNNYFNTINHPCPNNYNPADHMLFLLQTIEDKKELYMKPNSEKCINLRPEKYVIERIDDEVNSTFKKQLKELIIRELKNIYRAKGAIIIRLFVVIFLNTLYALIFLNRGDIDRDDYNLESHFGSLANLAISAMFSAIQPILLTFPIERPVFLREYSSGLYTVLPYFLTKTMIEMILNLGFTFVMMVITYWSIGFNGNFFTILFIFWLQGTVGSSLALWLGSLTSNVETAIQLTPLLLVPQILFSGVFLRVELIPSWLRWAQYTCFLKYTINLLTIEEFKDLNVQGINDLEEGLNLKENLEWLYFLVLGGLFLLFRITSMYFLAKRAKDIE